jgi:hypothetical protein
MEAIYFAIQNLSQGKKVIYPVADESIDTEHMVELLMPNEKSFQNDFLDVCVESKRYLCLPYNFVDTEDTNKKKHKPNQKA